MQTKTERNQKQEGYVQALRDNVRTTPVSQNKAPRAKTNYVGLWPWMKVERGSHVIGGGVITGSKPPNL